MTGRSRRETRENKLVSDGQGSIIFPVIRTIATCRRTGPGPLCCTPSLRKVTPERAATPSRSAPRCR